MPPRSVFWRRPAHTAIKHRILGGYLDSWLPVMASGSRRLLLVDGFAGPGGYTDGERGSPLIMLDAYLGHAARPNWRAEVSYLFVERDRARAAQLRALLGDRREAMVRMGQPPPEVRVGEWSKVFETVLDEMTAAGGGRPDAFAFLDPFGELVP